METTQAPPMGVDQLLQEGHARMGERNLVGARESFEAVLKLHPEHDMALFKLGSIATILGEFDLAERYQRRALAVNKDAIDIRAELGILAWRRFDDAEAVTQLGSIDLARPGRLRLAGYMAESLAALGGEREIAPLFEKCLRGEGTWTAEKLMTSARDINVVPACRQAFFEAAANVAGGKAAKQLKKRAEGAGPLSDPKVPEPWRSLLAMPLPKTVTACMIVKNEADMLPRLLASVQPMVDEIVVVDTGSTDETVAIAEAFGARIGRFDWCDDFSAARNVSLEMATGDWIFIVDADSAMDLSSRRSLRRFLQGPTEEDGATLAYAIQLVDHMADDPTVVSSRSYFLALFPNGPHMRYKGRLHEQINDLRPDAKPLKVRSVNDIVCHHYGYVREVIAKKDKKSRNMRILLKEHAAKPDDPFVCYNMALQERLEGLLESGIGHARECLALCRAIGDDFRPPYLESCYILLADLLVRRLEFQPVVAVCEEGLRKFPNCFDLHGRLGMALLGLNRPEAAIAPFEAALKRRGAIGASGSNADFAGWLSECVLALAHWRMGDAARCDHHLRHAWDHCDARQAMCERFTMYCGVYLGSLKAAQALMGRIGVRLALATA